MVEHKASGLTLNHLRRSEVWYSNVYSMVPHIIHRCVICGRLKRKLGFPKTFALPEERYMEVTQLTYSGVDMFRSDKHETTTLMLIYSSCNYG